ncbi:MAG: ribosome biogenesis GTP-binding protein YihA/YsxC [Bacilli bacterium]
MINFSNAKFIISSPAKCDCLETELDEILFVGRSNVGKSSMINSLTGQKRLAFISNKPGHTRLLNYFMIDKSFYLVDAPGYGYASGGKQTAVVFGDMFDSYLENNENLKLVVFLLDGRRTPNEDDIDLFTYLQFKEINFVIAITKIDKLNQSEKAKILNNLHLAGMDIEKERLFYTTCMKSTSYNQLKAYIDSLIYIDND